MPGTGTEVDCQHTNGRIRGEPRVVYGVLVTVNCRQEVLHAAGHDW